MKLNLGCGEDYKEGWVNVDRGVCKCDIKHDLEQLPLPFDNNVFEHIHMQHIMEHIPREKFIPLVRELYRISKPNATIYIISPYAGSDNYFTDPTHVMPLTERTFDFFDSSKPLGINGNIYGWDDIKFNVESNKLSNPPNGPDVEFKIKVLK